MNIPVYSVHTQLVEYADSSSRLDIILEVLVRSNYIDLFENVCKIANEFGIALENVTPVKHFEAGKFEVCNNFLFDNVLIIRYLRKRLPEFAERLVTVLDTCHVEMSKQFISLVAELFDNEVTTIPTMSDYFEMNSGTLKFIHLSRTVLNGDGIGRHGQPFTEDSRDYIREVLVCRERYAKDCDIVLEVAETDYSKSLGFDISNKLVREELDSLKR